MEPKMKMAGDTCINLEFPNVMSEEVSERILSIARRIEALHIPGILDIVPAYREVSFMFDPLVIDLDNFKEILAHELMLKTQNQSVRTTSVFEIPVLYNEKVGLDLKEVAGIHDLSIDEVIDLHANREYRIYMLGFLPGFSFLGGLDLRLHTARKATPRLEIPAGSIAIGGEQTGYYPVTSPGGWQIIGQTPLKMFDSQQPTVIFHAGDAIKFLPIDEQKFRQLKNVSVNDYFSKEKTNE
ncbi:5-oxoprolinase subunit PxpB [Fructobacillus cardui]|uniref:5-oxoprolinase subunit B/Allophanate hydrolase subunit 1 (PxpB) n=1 Tax=Fructobacillus cardui TaxID=2893170 RepID=A0ABN9Z029_9LACO|nr:5-oxoprolinase subunit B/Allophanate hydrolase subunit 1 (PxpB) [Fructobacillus cardui]CAK1252653.1 5-oxoprolinase subunit B/Allophanate hydrolase subunit 1 (PxpB) [Fructobacillus cardui]